VPGITAIMDTFDFFAKIWRKCHIANFLTKISINYFSNSPEMNKFAAKIKKK
jgi:hypothetical protein